MGRVFGLTGGIASGKSTVSRFLASEGVHIVDADLLAREAVQPGTVGLQTVVSIFGEEILLEDGALDRSKLGKIIFKDKDKRQTLEGIILPYIWEKIDAGIATSQDLVCIDAPTLIETGMYQKYRPLVVVLTTPKIQIERIIKRNGLSAEEAQSRLDAQVTNEVRRELADYTLYSVGTLKELKDQTLSLLERLR